MTIDPHLHRLGSLDAIYPISTRTLHAAPLIAAWITKHVSQPLLIGPDAESEQWVSAIGAECRAPHIVLEKRRHGDRDVEISVPDLAPWRGRTPVLVDDIISSAHTMIVALSKLGDSGLNSAVCIGVHGVFAARAYESLRTASPRIVTTNTIPHETNDIDVTPLLAEAVRIVS
jgi:ribose-phosphate pyrophosphokinase